MIRTRSSYAKPGFPSIENLEFKRNAKHDSLRATFFSRKEEGRIMSALK